MLLQQTAAGGLCALFLLLLQRIFRNQERAELRRLLDEMEV